MVTMTMQQLRDRMIQYLTITIPLGTLIVSILALCYFMWWNGDHSTGALIYSLIPFIMGILISIPGWFWKREAQKHDNKQK
jgi:heme/copper-type cytochrome/quinol oxidase subunit 4